MSLKSKLPDVGTTIFTIMSKMAADNGAMNLSQGYPDFDAHPDLIDLEPDCYWRVTVVRIEDGEPVEGRLDLAFSVGEGP